MLKGNLTKEVIETYVEEQKGTKVFMGDLTKEVLEAYVDAGEPM